MATKKKSIPVQEDVEPGLPVSDDDSNSDRLNEQYIYSGVILKSEYLLLKMIGFGNNASVWMTYHIKSKNYLAIKVQDHQCYDDGCREVAIIKKINAYNKENPKKNIYCIKLLDYFVYEINKKCRFVCSVYDLYAGSIYALLESGKYKYGLPIPVVKNIIRQLLEALVVLHGELEIIHTDIKPQNILFKGMPVQHLKIISLFTNSCFQIKYDNLMIACAGNRKKFEQELEILAMDSVKEICKLEDTFEGNEELSRDEESDSQDIIEGDYDGDDVSDGEDDDSDNDIDNTKFNTRRQSVEDLLEHLQNSEIHDLDQDVYVDFDTVLNNRANGTTKDTKEIIDDKLITNCEIALTDFGNSYFYKNRTKHEIQDRLYRAPEVILDFNYGYACDIWSVGCLAFELLTGFPLFSPELKPLTKDIHHLYLMEKMLGPIPLQMKKKSKRSRFLFDKKRKYHIKNVAEFKSLPIKERLIKQFLFNEADADSIMEFLGDIFKYNPNERATAKELLSNSWFKN